MAATPGHFVFVEMLSPRLTRWPLDPQVAHRNAFRQPIMKAPVQTSAISNVIPFPDDASLAEAARRGDRRARTAVYDRHARHIGKVLAWLLGPDDHLADCIQEVFLEAFEHFGELRNLSALRGWLSTIAVHVARKRIRKRRRWAWLHFVSPDQVQDTAVEGRHPEAVEAVKATYEILDSMPVDERMVFVLRNVEGLELENIATTIEMSLSTVNRRLRRAEERFRAQAVRHPALRERVQGGARWTSP